MKKNKFRLLVWMTGISLLIVFENSTFAQGHNSKPSISSMEMLKNDAVKIFSDNEKDLSTNQTENMLTDEQCRKWVGKRSVLQKRFTQINECSGDSVYSYFYEEGLLLQEGMGDQLFFLGEFKTTNKELHNGLGKEEVIALLGNPYKESDLVLVYKKELHSEIAFYEDRKFDESVILFFEKNKLTAIWVKFYMIC